MADARAVVEQVFEDGRVCEDCPHKRRIREGTGERLRSCRVLDDHEDPAMCPGYERSEA